MRRARVVWIMAVAAIVGFAVAAWLWPGRGPAPETSQAPAPTGAPTAPAPGELRVESGGTLEIEAASLEPGRPVVLRLVLGEPSKTDEPRPVRILAPDGRIHEGQGGLGADRMDARFELDPAFLLPGRYVVEVKTTELSHFPLRRYAIEVR